MPLFININKLNTLSTFCKRCPRKTITELSEENDTLISNNVINIHIHMHMYKYTNTHVHIGTHTFAQCLNTKKWLQFRT